MPEAWKDKYAPQSLDEMILSKAKRDKLERIMTDLPNTLLYGRPGTGKSTFMRILRQNVFGKHFMMKIDGSLEGGKDTIKLKVNPFAAASVGIFFGKIKVKAVYFEEADKLTNDAQNALKELIEMKQEITRFFFVCNDQRNIIEPIKSRCVYRLDLDDPPEDEIFQHISKILDKENVQINDTDDIYTIIHKFYPDIRSIISFTESNVQDGALDIDSSILAGAQKKRALKTAEQRREADRLRAQRWHENQKAAGKKQISCVISNEAHEILKEMEGQSYGQKIEKLLLEYGRKNN